jgi:hypothetical protein
VDHGNRTRQTFDVSLSTKGFTLSSTSSDPAVIHPQTPTSSYRPRVSLDAISQGSSSRYGTPSPSSMQGQNDFRTRLNRLSLQNSDSASPLSRSSSMRSRPGGGVADVGLGSRSTMLDRGSLRGGLDIGSREAAQYQQDSPYRPSTSQSRYDERGGISNPRNGRDHASTDRNRSRASPASSYSYRSARQSVSGGPSPSRTPTPTAALGYEDQLSTSSRWSQSRGSDRDATSRVSEYRQPGRTNESRGDGSSAARSVSNSTVRNFEENEDDTINFRKEKNRQIKRLEEDRAYRNTSPQLDRRSELRSERSFTPVSSHSQARGDERIIRPAEDPDMPAEEKVDMWMRSGSTRNGSGDDPAAKRRGALPFEFRSDMVGLDLHQYRGREYASDAFPSQATPTRPAAGGRQQTLTGPIHRASPARSSTGMDTSPLNAQRLSTGPATLYSGLRTSTSPTESMMTGSSRVDGAARNSEYYGTPERSLPPSMISNGSVAEDSDLAESRRRRKALLQSASRRTPLKIGSQTPIRSSTLDTSRGFDGRSQYAVGQIASEPRVSSRISHIRPSTSMSHLRDIQEPRRSVEDPRSYRQSMVYLPARTGDVGVEGLPDSPLARYHQRQTNSASMSPQTDGPFVTTRSSVLNPANGLPRAPSPTRSIMSTANSARPSTRGTPSRVAMTRLQAKLRRASDEQSKDMLEACVRLLTAFGVQEREKSAGNNVDLAGLIKNVQSVASTAEEAHQRAQSTLKKVDGLLAQCLEVDPDEDQDDDGEAAIVLVNVQAGLEEVKASLHQMGSGGKELIGLLTLVFDGLQGYHIHGQNANGNHLENVEETDTPAKTEGDAPIRSPETTFSSEEVSTPLESLLHRINELKKIRYRIRLCGRSKMFLLTSRLESLRTSLAQKSLQSPCQVPGQRKQKTLRINNWDQNQPTINRMLSKKWRMGRRATKRKNKPTRRKNKPWKNKPRRSPRPGLQAERVTRRMKARAKSPWRKKKRSKS